MSKYRLRPLIVHAEQNLTGQIRGPSGALSVPPGHWAVTGLGKAEDKPVIMKDDQFQKLCMPAEAGADLYEMLDTLLAANTDEYYPTIPCCFRCSPDHKRGRSADACACPGKCHQIRDMLKQRPEEDVHAMGSDQFQRATGQ